MRTYRGYNLTKKLRSYPRGFAVVIELSEEQLTNFEFASNK